MECQKAAQSKHIERVIDEPSVEKHRDLQAFAVQRSLLSSSIILTRIHAGYFRISLSLGWQALLWKSLLDPSKDSKAIMPHMVHSIIFITLWFFALLILAILSFLYILRCIFRFNMVKREFLHHVGVNYLFAPWISWLVLLQSVPFVSPYQLSYLIFWWVFTSPVVLLDVKIYGQWFTKGKRFLTAVANPTSQLSVIGTLVGARAAAQMGQREISICLFSLGMVHYLVLFVTLYQRFSGCDRLSATLRPVFFLFSATPSMASLAWNSIVESFDVASKMLFFLSLFLFMSLICRPTLFRKSIRRFNVAWWDFSYPITLLAHASVEYAREVKGGVPQAIMFILSALSVLVFVCLLVFTVLFCNRKQSSQLNDSCV